MDRSNRRDLEKLSNSKEAEIICLREHDPEKGTLDVPDPYYGGKDGFHEVYEIVHRSCERLLSSLITNL